MAGSATFNQIGPLLGHRSFIDKNRGSGSHAISTDGYTTPGNFTDCDALDAALTAINATSYSAARLLSMTVNDKVYALRVEATGDVVASAGL